MMRSPSRKRQKHLELQLLLARQKRKTVYKKTKEKQPTSEMTKRYKRRKMNRKRMWKQETMKPMQEVKNSTEQLGK